MTGHFRIIKCFSFEQFIQNAKKLFQKHRSKEALRKIFMTELPHKPHKLVLSVTPYRLNERLAYQKGTFLCPGDSTISFMDNMPVSIGNDHSYRNVIQFIIQTGKRGEIRDDALFNLENMNINRITLFPGLDGFAQSFKPRMPWFRSIKFGELPD